MINKVIIFSAPSGAGKTTVVQHLLNTRKDMAFSVSATTRKPRPGEEHGREYYFLSQEEFENNITGNKFVEWEQVYNGLFYGTLKSEVQRLWDQGKVVLFDVDVAGGINLKKIYGEKALSVFVKPPSLLVLEDRLRARGTETKEKLEERIRKARTELEFEDQFDRVLLNNKLGEALVEATVLAERFIHP